MTEPFDLEILLQHEYRYFFSDDQVRAFERLRVPPRIQIQVGPYASRAEHAVVVVAEEPTRDLHLVYCPSGHGPSFPWGYQRPGATWLGCDGPWCAYLVEAFVSSGSWGGPVPEGFFLGGRGERDEPAD